MVASQQAEITKWKNRAIKLKVKNKVEEDKLQSPSTPTKRGFPMTSDSSNLLSSPKKFLIPAKKLLDTPRKGLESPRKLLDSPKASLLESPKSRFFDVGGSSETLSRNCPKQFFDNSSLGTIPGKLQRCPLCHILSKASECHKDVGRLFCQRFPVFLKQQLQNRVTTYNMWGRRVQSLGVY